MARLARAEVFDPREVAALHICARVVRRCYFLGIDPVTGKNHDHRKIWIEDQLKLLSANFGIDILAFVRTRLVTHRDKATIQALGLNYPSRILLGDGLATKRHKVRIENVSCQKANSNRATQLIRISVKFI